MGDGCMFAITKASGLLGFVRTNSQHQVQDEDEDEHVIASVWRKRLIDNDFCVTNYTVAHDMDAFVA
jgi:hypothetical protein